ncbi:phosphotransferase family protein [Acinetobacter oleivorans]|uniref:phosphotransferase family protein n=1 Tax=Acinetobacter oleivorans TaxID=1148157 RepID=UPI0015808772|nr:phosphotransferase family protein [Acinetobacter oleivorans]NUF22638.1 phosphotransferase family protein [Acinetobacter oleivorans]NUF34494.1 phosphotransferase family protein [Acinetobacter oleivorans]
MSTIDVGGAVRRGEELDIDKVDQWLKEQDIVLKGIPQITQYSGGASNWTYRIQYENRDLILRRPPAGTKAKSAHDMQREYNVQKALKPLYPLVPEMVALCTDANIIGCDFYVMDRIEGVITRANLPENLDLTPEQMHQLCINAIDALIALHNVPYKGSDLETIGKGDGYCRRQVEGWIRRFEQAKTPDVASFKGIQAWLLEHIQDDVKICVIHNDWRLDNVILDPKSPTTLIGVLDWEMATLGDPLMDLGCALAYWIQDDDSVLLRTLRRQPTHLFGMLTRQEVVKYYLQKTGLQTDNWNFYEVFGLFRLAVICQQIYYRYYHKETQNPDFKDFGHFVEALFVRCMQLTWQSK